MKAHLISALNTFIATFFTTFGTVFFTTGIDHLDQAAFWGIVLSSVNVAVRAAMKVAVFDQQKVIDEE